MEVPILKRAPRSLPATEWILWLMVLFLAVRAAFLVPQEFNRVTCPFQVQQDEANHVDFGLRLARLERPYVDFRSGGPYLHFSYTPLYYFLQAFALLSGIGMFSAGRVISFGAFLGILALVYGWGRRRWKTPWPALITLLVAASPTWDTWASVTRSDVLSIFFNLAALSLWVRHGEGKGEGRPDDKRRWVQAGLLHAAAILTKQTTFVLGLAVLATGFLRRRWKPTFTFMAASWGTAVLILGLLDLWTGGLFHLHVIVWARGFMIPGRFASFITGSWWRECSLPTAMALMAFLLGRKPNPTVLAYGLGSALGLASLGRVGSAENYYLEFLLAMFLWIGEGWGVPEARTPTWKGWVSALGVLALTVSFLSMPAPTVPSPEERAQKTEAASWLRKDPGQVLLLDTDLALLSGHEVWYQPSTFGALYGMGSWNGSDLQDDLSQRIFRWVEIYDLPVQDRLPPPILESIRKYYRVEFRRFGRIWLKPRLIPAKRPDKPRDSFSRTGKR